MKTYRQFILEAKLSWWNGGRSKAKSKESKLGYQNFDVIRYDNTNLFTKENCDRIILDYYNDNFFNSVYIDGRAYLKYSRIHGTKDCRRQSDNDSEFEISFHAISPVELARVLKLSENS